MKAILTSFGRRANVDRRDTSDPSYTFKAAVASSSQNAPPIRTTFMTSTSPGGGIGDAPSSAPQYLTSGARTAKSSSFRGPSFPPSSYRDPSKQASRSDGTSRGFMRRLSPGSSRDASPLGQDARAIQSSAVCDPTSRPGSAGSRSSSSNLSPHSNAALAARQISTSTTSSSDVAGADISAMTSTELAARLNELAVANADGLLTEDEYRFLRQAVFDRMMKADEQSSTPSPASAPAPLGFNGRESTPNSTIANDSPSSSNAKLSTDLLSVDKGRPRSSLSYGDHSASSIRSGRSGKASSFQNVAQLFRGQAVSSKATMQKQSSQDSHSSHGTSQGSGVRRAESVRRDSDGRSSHVSAGDGQSQRASSFRTQQSAAAKSSRRSTFGLIRTSSQARRDRIETTAREMEETVSAERTAASLRAVSLYDAGGSITATSGRIDQGRSPTTLRADVAPSSLFGAEYEDKAPTEIQAEINVVRAEGDRMLGTFVALEETLMSKHSTLDPLVLSAIVDNVRSSNPLACVSSLDTSDLSSHGRRSSRAYPPSSSRTRRTATRASGLVSSESLMQLEDGSISADTTAFETELTSLYAQRAAVVKRYQDRLAFLQSKLRSATIREGLKYRN